MKEDNLINEVRLQSDSNQLEVALETATKNTLLRHNFYHVLMNSNVFILTQDSENTVEAYREANQHIDLAAIDIIHWQMQDGEFVIPFFSSIETMKKAIASHGSFETTDKQNAALQKFITLPVKELFEYTVEQTLFLNPNNEYSKIFYVDEIKGLLSTPQQFENVEVIEKVTGDMKIIALERLPEVFEAEAVALFKQHKHVKTAYLAAFSDINTQEKGYLLGLDLSLPISEKEIDEIFYVIGQTLSNYLDEVDILDMCLIESSGCEVSQFFLSHVPAFYQRKLGSFVRNAIDIKVL